MKIFYKSTQKEGTQGQTNWNKEEEHFTLVFILIFYFDHFSDIKPTHLPNTDTQCPNTQTSDTEKWKVYLQGQNKR